jgi:hypothetical protein
MLPLRIARSKSKVAEEEGELALASLGGHQGR